MKQIEYFINAKREQTHERTCEKHHLHLIGCNPKTQTIRTLCFTRKVQ